MIGLSKIFLNSIISSLKFNINKENKIYIKLNDIYDLNAVIVALKCMNDINYDEIFNCTLNKLPKLYDNDY